MREDDGALARDALCPVLIRRDGALAVLENALLAARRGESRFVVLAGEAGIGKTRLTRELVREARELGCAVLSGKPALSRWTQKTIVLFSWTSVRSARCSATARASTVRSMSSPSRVRSATDSR